MLRIASRLPSVAYATSPSGRRESFLVGEPLAVLAEFLVSPESPLPGEMSRKRQRGCTKEPFPCADRPNGFFLRIQSIIFSVRWEETEWKENLPVFQIFS